MGQYNVLLLTLSKLPSELNRNYYRYQSHDMSGFSQLEPIPQFLMQTFAKAGQALDEILIIASRETREKRGEIIIPESGKHTGVSNDYDFFVYRIAEYAGENNYQIPECTCIQDNGNMNVTINETVKRIRGIKEKEQEVDFYLDIHGGQRENQLTVDAIISLLRVEDIEIKEAYSCAGSGKDKEHPAEIREVRESLRSFDLVAAVNEFINYGKSEHLSAFFGKDHLPKESVKYRILSAADQISESILFCNPGIFREGLKNMHDSLLEWNKNESDEDALFDIFVDVINSDYDKEGLLPEEFDEDIPSDLSIIKWCIRKEFLQQGLTFIENRLPEFYIRNELLGYDPLICDDMQQYVSKRNWWVGESNCIFDGYGRDRWERGYRDELNTIIASRLVDRNNCSDFSKEFLFNDKQLKRILFKLVVTDQECVEFYFNDEKSLPEDTENNQKMKPGQFFTEYLGTGDIIDPKKWNRCKIKADADEKLKERFELLRSVYVLGKIQEISGALERVLQIAWRCFKEQQIRDLKVVFEKGKSNKAIKACFNGYDPKDSLFAIYKKLFCDLSGESEEEFIRRIGEVYKIEDKYAESLIENENSNLSSMADYYLSKKKEVRKLGDPETISVAEIAYAFLSESEREEFKVLFLYNDPAMWSVVESGPHSFGDRFFTRIDPEDYKLLDFMLSIHRLLKNERNTSNHGSSKPRTPSNLLRNIMSCYIEVLQDFQNKVRER